jgi:hypothetical protein
LGKSCRDVPLTKFGIEVDYYLAGGLPGIAIVCPREEPDS